MAKSERSPADRSEHAPRSAWLIGALAWFIPGVGHWMLGKWNRALLLGGVVWLCFFVGIAMGGHMWDLSGAEGAAALLQIPPMVGNFGSGALYIVSWLFGFGFDDNPAEAARVTYEYGNMILIIAGLLNYLTMLDAFDIAVGRRS